MGLGSIAEECVDFLRVDVGDVAVEDVLDNPRPRPPNVDSQVGHEAQHGVAAAPTSCSGTSFMARGSFYRRSETRTNITCDTLVNIQDKTGYLVTWLPSQYRVTVLHTDPYRYRAYPRYDIRVVQGTTLHMSRIDV